MSPDFLPFLDWNSALFIILNGTKEEHLDMLDGGIIQRLLEEKWKTFARLQFLKRLIILVFHLASLSLAVYFRPAEIDNELTKWPEEITDVVRVIAECITILGVLGYILLQLGGEIVNIGFISFFKQLSHEPAKFIFLLSNLLILACIPCRLSGDRHAEDAILVVAVPGSWFLLMFFAGAVRLTGPFVTMVYSMITGDMLTFGIIYMVVLFGFSQSFYFLYKGFPGVKMTLYHSYHSTWMALFQITLGDYSYTDLSNTTYPNLSKTVFAIFMVLVPILLLNMLIAMMGNTYAHVIEQSEKEWMKQWAKIVVSLERAVSQKDAHNYLQEYSIKLGPGDNPSDPASEQRGVMVIKSKSKTRAKQRKGAVSNWKRVGKVTIVELKKRGMTGEELRRIMWGRASFSTPIRSSPILEQPMPCAPGDFGDVLTTALDVMTFAIDVSTHPENLSKLPQQTAAEMRLSTTNIAASKTTEKVDARGLPLDSINRSTASVAAATAPLVKSAIVSPPFPPTISLTNDPLLNLMMATEDSVYDEETLLRLARSVRLVGEAAPAAPAAYAKTDIDPTFLERLALGNLEFDASAELMTQIPKPLKYQYLVESSDNDVCANENQLGIDARLQRIRSANSRLAPASSRKSCHRDVAIFENSLSSSSTTSLENASNTRLLNSKSEVAIFFTDNSAGRHFPGVEVENSKLTNSCKGQRKKPRIARNRISPKEIHDILLNVKSMEKNKSVSLGSTIITNDDPLEPWSTCNIKDMNAILAWKDLDPHSP